jgi:hypothetical protein
MAGGARGRYTVSLAQQSMPGRLARIFQMRLTR